MKKLLVLFSALTFVMGMTVAAYADDMVKGKVISIDSVGKTIVIDTTEGPKTVVLQDTTKGVKGVKPGMNVEMTCIDVDGKSCAKNIKVITVKQAGKHTQTVEGEVVSIDPDGKSIVIKSPKGKEMTITIKEAPVMEKVTTKKGAPAGEKVTAVPTTMSEIKAGMKVRVDCFDSEGKSCAKRVTVLSAGQASGTEIVGKVVSIDPGGKAVVVETKGGQKTLYYQKATTGAPLGSVEVGKRVKAYCLDVDGKSCIRDISVTK